MKKLSSEPWTESCGAVFSADGNIVADVITCGGSDSNADIRLIAAAPKLLEALRTLVRRSDNGDIIEPGWYEIEEARAAIAEAQGHEQS